MHDCAVVASVCLCSASSSCFSSCSSSSMAFFVSCPHVFPRVDRRRLDHVPEAAGYCHWSPVRKMCVFRLEPVFVLVSWVCRWGRFSRSPHLSCAGDGKCVICDSYVRPKQLVRICDECNYGSYEGRCVICGGIGKSDAYYCAECVVQEKDVRGSSFCTSRCLRCPVLKSEGCAFAWSQRDGCPKVVNVGAARTDMFYGAWRCVCRCVPVSVCVCRCVCVCVDGLDRVL